MTALIDPATVDLEGLTVRYGDTTAVDDVTLRWEPGAIHGLLGRNGSGKTSLLSALAGFRRPAAGRALLDGIPAFEDPRASARICLIREGGDTVDHDWPGDRIRDALAFAARFRSTWDQGFADRLVDGFRLDGRARLSSLSRGQRASLAVTLGLASRAPLTMFDEAYLGMDAPSRYRFYDELLADVAAHPRTVVISTHLIEEVARLFGHVTVIDRGRLVLHDDADTLRERGVTLTGPEAAVAELTARRTVLSTRRLGPTTAATVFGPLDGLAERARATGVEVEPAGLQDLVVHLTDPDRQDQR